mmetsp:Transcript_57639/g.165292  ORF Transcript_57639/g.165292 Transcript_57639/m.165292 type:complete len:239 (-) Transcript_57639:272-988(-)
MSRKTSSPSPPPPAPPPACPYLPRASGDDDAATAAGARTAPLLLPCSGASPAEGEQRACAPPRFSDAAGLGSASGQALVLVCRGDGGGSNCGAPVGSWPCSATARRAASNSRRRQSTCCERSSAYSASCCRSARCCEVSWSSNSDCKPALCASCRSRASRVCLQEAMCRSNSSLRRALCAASRSQPRLLSQRPCRSSCTDASKAPLSDSSSECCLRVSFKRAANSVLLSWTSSCRASC